MTPLGLLLFYEFGSAFGGPSTVSSLLIPLPFLDLLSVFSNERRVADNKIPHVD
jgi:hypothetical protein